MIKNVKKITKSSSKNAKDTTQTAILAGKK